MSLLRQFLCATAVISVLNTANALPIHHNHELWVLGKIINEGYVNWSYQLNLTAYNSNVVPEGYVNIEKRVGQFRISTFANSQQTFDLNYQSTSTDDHDYFTFHDEPLCRFTLKVNQNKLTQLSVVTLDNSYVQCNVSQDDSGTWVITLKNPEELKK